jgi:hypothetical protein
VQNKNKKIKRQNIVLNFKVTKLNGEHSINELFFLSVANYASLTQFSCCWKRHAKEKLSIWCVIIVQQLRMPPIYIHILVYIWLTTKKSLLFILLLFMKSRHRPMSLLFCIFLSNILYIFWQLYILLVPVISYACVF